MRNCLITKLQGVVNNPSIMKLGEFCINVSALGATEHERTITFSFSGTSNIRATNNQKFIINGTEYSEYTKEGAGGVTITVNDADYKIFFTNKYSLLDIAQDSYFNTNTPQKYPIAIDMSQFDYSHITNIWASAFRLYGTLKNTDSITAFLPNIYGNPIAGEAKKDFYVHLGAGNPTSIGAHWCENITGNIETFTNVITGRFQLLRTKVTGDIDAFARSQVALGKTSGVINVEAVLSGITDEGNALTNSYLQSKGGLWSILLTFDSSLPNGYSKSYE